MPVIEEPLGPGILRWTLSNPGRANAVDPAMLAWITERAPALRGEVVILTGAGERVFSGGFDLKALAARAAARDPAGPTENPGIEERSEAAPDQPLIDAIDALEAADATLIAAIQGLVIGAGVELICACDLRLARPGITFQVPAQRLGVVYHAAGILRLHRTFGIGLARRLLLVGEAITGEEAAAAGVLDHLVAGSALAAAAEELAAHLLTGSPAALRAHRQIFRALGHGTLPPELALAHQRARAAAYAAADLTGAAAHARGRSS